MPKRIAASIAIVWLVAMVFVGYLAVILWTSYRTYETNTGERALSFVRLVEQHATAKIDGANTVLLEIADHLQAADFVQGMGIAAERRRQIESVLKQKQGRVPGIVSISLTDAEGRVFVNSLGVPPGSNLGDRRYFLDLKAAPRSTPVISEVVKGRVSNRWGIQIARRFDLPGGRFGGTMIANLGLSENFERFYHTICLPDDSIITMRDADNRLLVRYPVETEKLGTVIAGSAGAKLVQSGRAEGVAVSTSPVDGVVRFVAVRKLPEHAIYAIVGLGREVAMKPWHKELLVALYVGAGAVAAAMFLTYSIRRREQALLELETANQGLNDAHRQVDESHRRLEVANAELCKALAVAERNASRDKLTGLWNRRAFDQRLEEAVARAKRIDLGFSLLLFDLDNFKAINDNFGHLVGDNVLFEFAQVINSRIRVSDVFARWGGEEFILLVEATDAQRALVLAEELRLAIAGHIFAIVGKLTVSIGIAEYRPEDDLENVLRRADRALYAAKTEGRDRVSLG